MFENILTEEVLKTECLENLLTWRAIARKYNTTVKTVCKYCKIFNIKRAVQTNSWRTLDLIGQTFGRLIVIKKASVDKFHKARWVCKCSCGKTKTVNASSLLRKLTLSCGCLKAERARSGFKDISGQWWRRQKNSAFQRKIPFKVTEEDVWDLYERQDRKCALTDLPITFCADGNRPEKQTASLDRIDSYKGYSKDNIQIVHKTINIVKGWLDEEDFFALCNLVANKHRRDYEDCINKTFKQIASKTRS